MQNAILRMLVVTVVYASAFGQDQPPKAPSNEVIGVARDGLLPVILTDIPVTNVCVTINFRVMSNVIGTGWLMVTNQAGAKVKLWASNGVEVALKDPNSLAVWNLPVETTVSNVMSGVDRSRRVQLWWASPSPTLGHTYAGYSFLLESLFGIAITNDVIMELTPLMYKANASNNIVRLIEFPAIHVKVKPNGDLEKVASERPAVQ